VVRLGRNYRFSETALARFIESGGKAGEGMEGRHLRPQRSVRTVTARP
jgi:hypothetical protein